jgi:outer membrane lipase/esterase
LGRQVRRRNSTLRSGFQNNNPKSVAALFDTKPDTSFTFADNAKGADSPVVKASAKAAVDKTLANKPTDKKWSVFGEGYGLFINEDGSLSKPGLDGTTAGAVFGFDYHLLDNLTVGFNTGFSFTDSDVERSSNTIDSNGFSVGGQASYFTSNGLYIDAVLNYGWNNYDTKRRIVFGTINRTAKGETDGNQLYSSLGGGYDHRIGNWTLGPTGVLEFVHVDIDGFTEKGANALNLKIGDQDADSLKFLLGGKVNYLARTSWGSIVPELRAEWVHEFLYGQQSVSAQFANSGAGNFTAHTRTPTRDSALLGAGVNFNIRKNITFNISYDTNWGSDVMNQSVQGGLRIRF